MTPNSSNIIASTFTCVYDSREDRLRFVINYQDIHSRGDFWITRSFLLKLLPMLAGYAEAPNISIPIPQESDSLKSITSTSATDHDMLNLAQKEPFLLEQVRCEKKEGSVVMYLSPKEGAAYTASLQPKEIKSIYRMLINTAPTYGWGIGPWWD